jgi:hypothetical protein
MRALMRSAGVVLAFGLAVPALAQDFGVSGSVELAAGASPRQMIDFVEGAIAEMDQAIERVTALLREAEKSGDADAVDCVSAKLRTVKNMRDVSVRVQAAVNNHLAAGVPAKADYEARKIGVAVGMVRRNLTEAEACVGGSSGAEGEDIRDGTSARAGGLDETDAWTFEDDLGVDPPNTSPF